MTNTTIKLKRSSVPGKIPEVQNLDLGELAINTNDGKIFIKKNDGVESIIEIGPKDPIPGANTQIIFNDGGVLAGADNFAYNANTGNVLIGTETDTGNKLSINGDLKIRSSLALDSITINSSNNIVTLGIIPVSSFSSGKFFAQAKDIITGELQVSEIILAHNGVNSFITEYGIINTDVEELVLYSSQINGSNVELIATKNSPNELEYKLSQILIVT
jgi:hypothetical protein